MGLELETAISPAVSSATKDRVPVIKSLAVGNDSVKAANDLKIHILAEPHFAKPKTISVKSIGSSEKVKIKNADVQLDEQFLSSVTARTDGRIIISIEMDGETVIEESYGITVLPPDDWFGIDLIEMTASFISPQNPAVLRIAASAAKLLSTWMDDVPQDKYASGDREDVRRYTDAVYTALQTFDIRGDPSRNIARTGCKVTSANDMIANGRGTSLDLVFLFVSCAMSIGLNPVIVFTKERTVAGIWTDETISHDTYQEDVTQAKRLVRDGAVMLIDCDGVTTNKRMGIDASESSAKRALLKEGDYLIATDVWLLCDTETTSVIGKSAADRREVEKDKKGKQKLSKIESWEKRLLDISLSNELIKMRMNETLLPLMTNNLSSLRDALVSGDVFTILGRPTEWDDQVMNEAPFELSRYVGKHSVLIEQELRQRQIRSPYTEKELKKRLTEIRRRSRASEFNCKCTLYVVMGLLKWFDDDGNAVYSPLVLMPAETDMRSVSDIIRIKAKDDESIINKTLLEKLKQEHDIALSLDPLPTDRTGVNLKRIFDSVTEAVRAKDGWDVIEGAFVGIFRPSRYNMWVDLRNRSDKLFFNKLTRSIMEGKLIWDPPGIDNLDLYKRPIFAFNSNSIQLTAVKAATEGRTFVVTTSPSTGRTQMISSMIANTIYNGKTVLLVSERAASLKGVKKRLDDIGLGRFCLHLTTANANMKRVLDDFRLVLDSAAIRQETNYRSAAEQIEKTINELSEPLRATKKIRNCGINVYEIIVRYNELDKTGVKEIDIPEEIIRTIAPDSIDRWEEMVSDLITAARALGHPMTHPLSDIGMTSFGPETEEEVRETLDEWLTTAANTERTSRDLTELLSPEKERHDPGALARLLVSLSELPEDLVKSDSISGSAKNLHELLRTLRHSFEIINNLRRTFVFDAIIDDVSSLEKNHDRMRHALDALKYFRLGDIGLNFIDEYVNEILIARDTMSGSLDLSREVRKEWNDSIMSADINEIMNQWREVNEKKMFAGGAKKAFIKDISKHLKNKNVEFDRVVNMMRPVEEYAARINEAKALLAEMDVLEGGKFADLMDRCRKLERMGDIVGEKIKALEEFGNADRLCKAFAADEQVTEGSQSLVSLTTELEEKRMAVERLLVTNISRDTEDDDINGWRKLCKKWTDGIGELENIALWNICKDALDSEGMRCVADAYMDGLDHDVAMASFRTSVYSRLMNMYISSEPSFATFDANAYKEKTQKFTAAMERFIPLCRREIDAALASKVPDITGSEVNPELQTLQNAIVTWGRRTTLRSLLNDTRTVLPRLFPCVMMNPSSVPHYLNDDVSFDLVILDDAIVMPTDKAVALITRGKDAVIVGNPQYIPPAIKTSEGMTEVTSILDECMELGLPMCELRWLYNNESLVEFYNERFCNGHLRIFPHPDTGKRGGLRGIFVSPRGDDPPNVTEAEMVVKKVMMKLRERAEKRKSIGVIAFNEPQRQLIEDTLKRELMRYPTLSSVMHTEDNPLFVKLAERAQNHERDIIILSPGIWKDANGILSDMSPLDGKHGEKILNAVLSSSRKEVSVFTTLRSADIPKSGAEGVKAFKALLQYTEEGYRRVERPVDNLCDTVAKALTDKGYIVHKNVGLSSAAIDLGVADPEAPDRCVLGILLDGGEFINMSAVDTNFGHPLMLKELGWDIHHLWAVNWMNDPEKEINIIVSKINDKLKELEKQRSEKSILDMMMVSEFAPKTSVARVDIGRRVRQLYTKATIMEKTVSLEALFSNSSRRMVERDVMKIVEAESPVSAPMVAKRLCDAYGIKNPTPKLMEYLIDMMDTMDVSIMMTPWNVKILWSHLRDTTTYDTYRVPPRGEKREMSDIAVKEQTNAIIEAIVESTEISLEDLLDRVGDIFGNESMTEYDKQVVMMCIDKATEDKLIKIKGGKITLSG